MPRERLTILDVGHGNCAVLEDTGGVLVVDAGKRGTGLLEFLRQEGIDTVDVLLLSHADEDHIAGVLDLLSEPSVSVRKVRLNSDASKGTKIWEDLRVTLEDAQRRGTCDPKVGLHTGPSGEYSVGSVDVEILAPGFADAASGPGAASVGGGPKLNTNSHSVVIRLVRDGSPIALLPGDVDIPGLARLLERVDASDLRAPVVVFPHHGGWPGKQYADSTIKAFVQAFCEAVQPSHVIFSTGRGEHKTPQPVIVDTVREALGNVHVACTQLSERCANSVPEFAPAHLLPLFARGRKQSSCCAGTLEVLTTGGSAVLPYKTHEAFVAASVPDALCRTRIGPSLPPGV